MIEPGSPLLGRLAGWRGRAAELAAALPRRGEGAVGGGEAGAAPAAGEAVAGKVRVSLGAAGIPSRAASAATQPWQQRLQAQRQHGALPPKPLARGGEQQRREAWREQLRG